MDLSWLHQLWNQSWDAPIAAQLFTLGAVAVWLLIALSAWRRAELNSVALLIATLFCFSSEYLAIRFGKYHYAQFPLSLPPFELPGLSHLLASLSGVGPIPEIVDLPLVSKHVPVEVALLEGALLYSVFRITNLLSPQLPLGEFRLSSAFSWLRQRWPNPVFNGFLAVNIDAMLDPIVSGTFSIDGSGLTEHGLGLWTWHTNAHYAGHWFGIPIANYNAWFAALFAFTIATRVGKDHVNFGGTRLQQGKLKFLKCVKSVGKLIGLLFLVKFSLDYVTYEMFGLLGSPTPLAWQFAIIGALNVAGIVAGGIVGRRARRHFVFEWVTVMPLVLTFAYCAGALFFAGVYTRSPWFFPLWLVTGMIAFLHGWAPWAGRSQAAEPRPAVAL